MYVLMITRSNHFSGLGGDTIQIENTANFLRKLGIKVDIKLGSSRMDYSQYDLIHFFNITRPANILPHIRRTDIPFVISPIFVDYLEYEQSIKTGVRTFIGNFFPSDSFEYLKVIARKFKNNEPIGSLRYLFFGHRAAIKYASRQASMLLPNSVSEYNRFSSKYNLKVPYQPIPNAINSTLFSSTTKPNQAFSNGVICVARIEGLKNQQNLIKAMEGLKLKLFIIGKPSPNHVEYYQKCREMAGANVTFVDHVPQNELPGIYKAARVHVLPSWFETTGLSSLEAAAMGCNIVISDKGDQREYFKNFAFYCNPSDVESIRNAIIQAYAAKPNSTFQNYIFENYTWEITANKTLEAYTSILGEKH
jgi:glycosyltransferase involved in cell wall biosynthesis